MDRIRQRRWWDSLRSPRHTASSRLSLFGHLLQGTSRHAVRTLEWPCGDEKPRFFTNSHVNVPPWSVFSSHVETLTKPPAQRSATPRPRSRPESRRSLQSLRFTFTRSAASGK